MVRRFGRRDFVKLSALGAGAMMLPWGCATTTTKARKPDFSAAFMTDMHVYDEKKAAEGFETCLRYAMDRPDPAQFIITGGDLAMDILATGVEEADAQYELYFGAIDRTVNVPVHHVIGNHDTLGVYKDSGLTPDHPKFGKTYFLERFKQDKPYKSFDHDGWHFVLLDTVGIDVENRDYYGHIDEEQLRWLDDDLASANKPTVIAMHIPLLTSYNERREGIEKPDHKKAVVGNVPQVIDVMEKHPVKLVLGGHLHINESYTFRGIEYANIGAVSGRWWRGARDGFEEGYARLEFFGDRVRWRYVDYGWEVEEEAQQKAG
ncbi:hypothetical protein GF324_11345 [bacterium]|nr:hypothetical protein [bacterium]